MSDEQELDGLAQLISTDRQFEQLKQLLTVTCVGNLISKETARWLESQFLAAERGGWWFLTGRGVKVLIAKGVLML